MDVLDKLLQLNSELTLIKSNLKKFDKEMLDYLDEKMLNVCGGSAHHTEERKEVFDDIYDMFANKFDGEW